MRYAQQARYWSSKVSPANSKAQIEEYIRKAGGKEVIIAWSDEKQILVVVFQHQGVEGFMRMLDAAQGGLLALPASTASEFEEVAS